MNLTSNAVIALIVLAVSAGGVGYGLYERQAKLAAQAQIATVKAQDQVLRDEVAQQNASVDSMKLQADVAQAAAQDAEKAAQASNAKLASEEDRLKTLINQPQTSHSCDSAWDKIESNHGVIAP